MPHHTAYSNLTLSSARHHPSWHSSPPRRHRGRKLSKSFNLSSKVYVLFLLPP